MATSPADVPRPPRRRLFKVKLSESPSAGARLVNGSSGSSKADAVVVRRHEQNGIVPRRQLRSGLPYDSFHGEDALMRPASRESGSAAPAARHSPLSSESG